MSNKRNNDDSVNPPGLLGKSDKGPVFEPGYHDREGKFTFVRNPEERELSVIHDLTLREIGAAVAEPDVMRRVYRHNRDSLWALYRSETAERRDPKLIGYVAYLPLSEAGHAALQADTLDACDPNLEHLAANGERPAALYTWAMVARGACDLASALVAFATGLELHDSVPIYGRIGTEGGLKALQRKGRSPTADKAKMGSLFRVQITEQERAILHAMPVVPGTPKRELKPKHIYSTAVAATADDVARAFAIRAAVFMAEQNCPYDEEFDGNDQAATHILGCVDGEPAATLRLRYFGGFVKMERLAVLPRYRLSFISKDIVEYAIALIRKKGFTRIYGTSQLHLTKFWGRFGFRPLSKNETVVFSDHQYVEVMAEFPPVSDAFTPYSDPMVLIRPEGRWDVPGVLDRSAQRPATNPRRV
jgi:predicted GNAT family N-acyltransferase